MYWSLGYTLTCSTINSVPGKISFSTSDCEKRRRVKNGEKKQEVSEKEWNENRSKDNRMANKTIRQRCYHYHYFQLKLHLSFWYARACEFSSLLSFVCMNWQHRRQFGLLFVSTLLNKNVNSSTVLRCSSFQRRFDCQMTMEESKTTFAQ